MGNSTSSSAPPQNINNNGNNINNGTRSNSSNGSPSSGAGNNLVNALSTLRKTAGNHLGLSKTELDKRCKPSGLYDSCLWEEKAIRRCIGDGKLAARLKGSEERETSSQRECPICFFFYDQINVTSCCKAYLCTECYLQVRPQREKNAVCPFCTSSKFSISLAKNLNEKDIKKMAIEEKIVEEATKRSIAKTEFGKSLEQKNEKALKSANDRFMLEEEMKKQHLHPLSREMEQEAAEMRREHDLNYNRRQRSRRFGGRDAAYRLARSRLNNRRRDWNQIVEAFENHYNTGEVSSIDDLVVIEAAILLSMEEEAAQRRRQDLGLLLREEEENDTNSRRNRRFRRTNNLDDSIVMRGVSEDDQIAMAIALSLRESEASNNNSSSTSSNNSREQSQS